MERLGRDSLKIVHVEDNDDFATLTANNLRRGRF